MSAIDWLTLRDAIHTWFVTGSGLDNGHVIWAGQCDTNGNPAPRPVGQYISFRMTVLMIPGSDWSDYILNNATGQLTQFIRGPRKAILTAQCFQGLPIGGQEIDLTMCAMRLHDVAIAQSADLIYQALVDAGVGVSSYGNIQTTNHVISQARNEGRAIMDVNLSLAAELAILPPINTGWIEFVNGSGIAGTDAAPITISINGTTPSNVKLVAIWGQSSAVGRGNVNTLVATATPPWTAPFPSVTLRQAEYTPADPPVLVYADTRVLQPRTWNSSTVNMGIELSLGRFLNNINASFSGIVKYGLGSIGLDQGFKPLATYPTAPPHLDTRIYNDQTAADAALQGTIAVGFFMGCETDALTSGPANAVGANLTAMMNAFRSVHGSTVPFGFLRLTSALPIGVYPFRDTVIAQENAFLAANASNHVFMVTADDLAIDSGNHEYVGDSLITIGNRVGLAICAALGINIIPVANWSVGTSSLQATFTDLSTDADGSIVSWAWGFGDGNTSTTQNPVHTYASSNTYSVTLVVTDNSGATASKTSPVSVSQPSWNIDPLSGKGIPLTLAEWQALIAANSLTIPAPNHLWIFDAASGNVTDVIGGKTLTAGNSPGRQQSVTNWAAFFAGPSGAAANQTFLNASMQNVNAHSSWSLEYGLFTLTAQNMQRMFHGGADNNAFESNANTRKMRLRTGSNSKNSTLDHDGAVRPFSVGLDLSNSLNKMWSDIEVIQLVTFAVPASGTNFEIQTGISLDTAAVHQVCMAVQWEDFCPTNAQVKATYQALGWPVSGY